MKHIIFLFLIGLSMSLFAQEHQHINKSFVASGFDLVSYFEGKPVKGKKKFSANYNGGVYKFSNRKNLDLFEKKPEKYMPQYGGWCAYVMSSAAAKANVNPRTYEIRDGKLYLFYNTLGANTLEFWLKEGPNQLKEKANANWKQINSK